MTLEVMNYNVTRVSSSSYALVASVTKNKSRQNPLDRHDNSGNGFLYVVGFYGNLFNIVFYSITFQKRLFGFVYM